MREMNFRASVVGMALVAAQGLGCGGDDTGPATPATEDAQAQQPGTHAGGGSNDDQGPIPVPAESGSNPPEPEASHGIEEDATAVPEASAPGPGTDASDASTSHDAAMADVKGPDGDASYNPCPAKGTPCAIMPLGDSITDGMGSSGGGYRPQLFHLALSSGTSITFVGTASDPNGPNMVDGVAFPKNHEGHSGYTIQHDTKDNRKGIADDINLVSALQTTKPNIVALMIGTNDMNLAYDLPNAPMRLGALIDEILGADSKLLLVIAKIVPTTTDSKNVNIQAYNAAIPDLVSSRAAVGKHIVWVDMYAPFTANANYKTALMSDELHPKDAGYAVMANVWYAAMQPLFR